MNDCNEQFIDGDDLTTTATALLKTGCRFQMAYTHFPQGKPETLYFLSQSHDPRFLLLRVKGATEIPSLTSIVPLLGWYEREITELSGIVFRHHPEPYPLVVHEGLRLSCPPLAPAVVPVEITGETLAPTMPEIAADQVQDLVWGPVRADVVESGEFHFSYIGENILHYHARLFYKHRGLEKRFEGLRPEQGVVLAERVSGVGSVCHALAYCQAVEAALGIEIPERARLLRVILTELERLYNHCHYFGLLAKTTTLKVGAATGFLLEERCKQLNGRLTGSRFLRSLLTIGGLRRDLPAEILTATIPDLIRASEAYLADLAATASYLDRLMGTGVLSTEVAFDEGATGPVGRASGLDRDMRRDHPYAAYGDLRLSVPVRTQGDALARAEVRTDSLREAGALIMQAVARLQPGAVRSDSPDRRQDGEGLGWAETPRGALFYAVHVHDHHLTRVKIKSPSFSNWRVFPFTVHGSNMMDYAINEASFGLTIAGCDR